MRTMNLSMRFFAVACLFAPLCTSAQTAELVSEIVLRNVSGNMIENVKLDVRVATSINSIQEFLRSSTPLRSESSATIATDDNYARVFSGSLLPGETARMTLSHTVNVIKDAVPLGERSTSIRYSGYQARVENRHGNEKGDCSEMAFSTRDALRRKGHAAEVVTGFVISTDPHSGQRQVTHHDWVWQQDSKEFLDPSAHLLPGANHTYIALGTVASIASRFPMYITNLEGIEVSLRYR